MPRTEEPLKVERLPLASVQAIRNTYSGAGAGLARRLAETALCLAFELAEMKSKQRKEPLDVERSESAFESREKVLVVVEYDGMIEVFAQPWVDVKAVELEPWDDPTFIEGLPPQYAELHYANKCRTTAIAKMRKLPEFNEILSRYAIHEERIETIQRVRELIEQFAKPLTMRAAQ